MKRFICLIMVLVLSMSLLMGCGKQSEPAKEGDDQSTQQETQKKEQVTLKFFHYQSEGQETFTEIINKFKEAYPNIKVEADISGGDQYRTILKTKFAASESADIVGVHPGRSDAILYAKSGYLEDLTDEDFIKKVDDGALRMGTYEGKNYALPIDTSYIAAYYNKDTFNQLNLQIPKTWTEFLEACEKIKQNKITPIAVGNKDLWVTQLIPYAIAPTIIYSHNPDFDNQMYDGKVKFNGPEWKKVMAMYKQLNDKGYFNDGMLSTTYDQSLAIFAQEKAAMTIMGTWATNLIKELNPNINLGLFVLPASEDGNNWASGAVGGMLAVSESSEHKAEAKQFLEFFMKEDIYNFYLSNTKNFPTAKGVTVDFDAAAEELTQQVSNSYNFLDQNWPAGIQDVFLKGYQEFFVGKSAEEVLSAVDQEWDKRISK